MRFADVMAPIDVGTFQDAYLDQRWVVVEGARGRYGPLVPWSDLNRVLATLRVPRSGERLRLVKDGKKISEDTYMHPSAWGSFVRTGAFERHLAEGATLVLNGVDELFPELRELADDTERCLGAFSWANLYAGWRTQRGFDLHWDTHDTIILQVDGRKAWTVYAPTCEWPTKEFAGSRKEPTDPPVWEGILEAGSALYMPRGWWHVAVPMDEPTLHVTLGIRALVGRDVLDWLETQLCEDRVYRANVPYRHSRARDESYLAEFRDRIAAALSGDCLDRLREHHRAGTPRVPVPALPDAIVPLATIRPDSALWLGTLALELSPLPDGRVSVATPVARWTCSSGLVGALRQLTSISSRRFADLSQGLSLPLVAELKILLTAMHLQGALVIRSTSADAAATADRYSIA